MKKLTQRRRDAESELVSTGNDQATADPVHSAMLHSTSLRLRVSAFFVFFLLSNEA